MDQDVAALPHRFQPHVRPVNSSIAQKPWYDLCQSFACCIARIYVGHYVYRSVLAMRSVAHERGANVQAVRAYMEGSSCVLDHRVEATNDSEDGLYSGDNGHMASAESTNMMLALPLECNLTGLRCSDAALDALCQGRVRIPDKCRNVRFSAH